MEKIIKTDKTPRFDRYITNDPLFLIVSSKPWYHRLY